MNSPTSASDAEGAEAFGLLHPKVQQWVWDQQWPTLRPVQIRSIRPVLDEDHDVIISASTASGKTEAAWLPIASALAETPESSLGIKALYVSPLKALINDQYIRLQSLCEKMEQPINRRHGDVGGSERRDVETTPDGVLLITPEALEALFVLRGTHIPRIFAGLRYVVIDEMHSFIGTERGAQLQSQLHRIELAVRRRVPRIGLSATFADFTVAQDFLRPRGGRDVIVVESPGDRTDLLLQVRGYVDTAASDDDEAGVGAPMHSMSRRAIARHLFDTLRTKNNLVFANSRANVEAYTDMLQELCDEHRIPQSFFPHHGNLAKGLREDLEERLKSSGLPTTAICTSTLEMGVDIGSADSVAQVGAPYSVSAIRQRVGRSGRRGSPAVLRAYVPEKSLDTRAHISDRLRTSLVQTIAVIELMLEKWYEPPNTSSLHLSTLVQQILSVIAQHGGASATQLNSALCSDGPFEGVDRTMFGDLLRSLGECEVLMQSSDGTLLPGKRGEGIVNHYSFYAAFQTSEEYRLVNAGQLLGTVPVDYPLLIDSLMIFAGRRWRVTAIDSGTKTIELVPATAGKAPSFGGSGGEVADGIRRRMRELYESSEIPAYLDTTSSSLLDEGRSHYSEARLDEISLVRSGSDSSLIIWRGSRVINTISVLLTAEGIDTVIEGPAITCPRMPVVDLVAAVIQRLEQGKPTAIELARLVPDKITDKHDSLLSDDLLAKAYAASQLDIDTSWDVLEAVPDLPLPQSVTEPERPLQPTSPGHDVAIGSTAFAVIDVETTKLSPQRGGRIVEIAIVRLTARGEAEDEWSSILDPESSPGRTDIHGLTATDTEHAPRFVDVLDEVAHRLSGRIVIAHNAAFDLAFLRHEFESAGVSAPFWPRLCTRDLARLMHPGQPATLEETCRRLGIENAASHEALSDAQSSAAILAAALDARSPSEIQALVEPTEMPVSWPLPVKSTPMWQRQR